MDREDIKDHIQEVIDFLESAYPYVEDNDAETLRRTVEILTDANWDKCFCPMCR